MKLLILALLSSSSAFADLVYESAGNDTGAVSFILKNDKTFVIEGGFFDEGPQGEPTSKIKLKFKHTGTYAEDKKTDDLKFKNENAKSINELIKDSKDLWYIPDSKKVRMNKDAKDLRIYQIKMLKK